MVRWSYIIFLSVLCMASACPPELQTIEICKINVILKKCHCALLGEQYDKPLSYCNNFLAMSEANTRRIGTRLAECKKLEERCEEK